jgi:hypothetical protein
MFQKTGSNIYVIRRLKRRKHTVNAGPHSKCIYKFYKSNYNNCRKKYYNEELHNLYSSPSIIRMIKSRRMRWAGHVARMREKRNVYRILVGKPDGRKPLGRRRRRWVDNIKMDLKRYSMGWYGLD